MKILKIDNMYHSEMQPSIMIKNGYLWFLNNRLHRSGGLPAVQNGNTELYYHRGINITQEMASGGMTPQKVLAITNMEQRQAAMEIIGYEKFLAGAKLIHSFSPAMFTDFTMYELYLLRTNQDEKQEPIKILKMYDPSKRPFVQYYIRVHPREIRADEAVAHSYKFKSYKEFEENKNWV